MSFHLSIFKKNIAFNSIGQIYSTAIGILILPFFLKHMGAEAYGLVGFFTLMQAWLNLLDVGLSPTLGREVARLKNKVEEHWRLVTVVNSLELTFFVMALCASTIFFIAKDWIASGWLTVETLNIDTVQTVLGVMAIMVSARWIASINRSGINAYEAQVWMNITDIVINTLRFPGALILVIYTDGDILFYFYFQLAIVLVEVTVIRIKMRNLLPRKTIGDVAIFSFSELKRIAPFALSIGYTSGIWILLTQLDKLLLSRYLTLSEYGYFTLIGIVVSGMMMLSSPVNKAILPRMTAMLSEGRELEMLKLYRVASRLVSVFIFPVGLIVAFNSEVVVYTWTNDRLAAAWIEPILPLFILGSIILVIVTFQYYLQYAHGQLKYHVYWNTFSVLVNVPLIIYAATYYGAVGVGWVWLGFRLFSFFVWGRFVHQKFAPGLHAPWLLYDVLIPFCVASLIIFAMCQFYPMTINMSRFELFVMLFFTTIFSILLTSLVVFHRKIWNKINVRKY